MSHCVSVNEYVYASRKISACCLVFLSFLVLSCVDCQTKPQLAQLLNALWSKFFLKILRYNTKILEVFFMYGCGKNCTFYPQKLHWYGILNFMQFLTRHVVVNVSFIDLNKCHYLVCGCIESDCGRMDIRTDVRTYVRRDGHFYQVY